MNKINIIKRELEKEGDFCYSLENGILTIGIRQCFNSENDEFQIFECKDYKIIKEGLIKRKNIKKSNEDELK